jgi:tRNA A37 threonylcarbamoyladenosine modification protein TsaB
MIYTLELTVNQTTSSLVMKRDGTVLKEKSWTEERDMGKQLLTALKEIFEETGVRPEEVETFLVEGEAPENFTSRRIAETVRNVYTFAVRIE